MKSLIWRIAAVSSLWLCDNHAANIDVHTSRTISRSFLAYRPTLLVFHFETIHNVAYIVHGNGSLSSGYTFLDN